jgi:hypothetical protein
MAAECDWTAGLFLHNIQDALSTSVKYPVFLCLKTLTPFSHVLTAGDANARQVGIREKE